MTLCLRATLRSSYNLRSQDDPNGCDKDMIFNEIILPEEGSINCGRDHKSCHLIISDIYCSRKQGFFFFF